MTTNAAASRAAAPPLPDPTGAAAPPRRLAPVLSPATQAAAHGGVAVAAAFLIAYNQFVCPFMEELPVGRLAGGLAWVLVAQIALRHALWHLWPVPAGLSLARHGWRIAVVAWIAAGIGAALLHEWRYDAYPPVSHVKLLTGYWVLGAGLMAQVEYTLLEDHLRRAGLGGDPLAGLHERITRRLSESTLAFAVAPAAALVMMAIRQVEEGHAEPVILVEVLFIATVFVATAVAAARHYGRSLRRDTDAIVAGLDSVTAGRFDVRLDGTRPDELGRVAVGINAMASGLAQRERIRDAFGRFVSPEVAERVLAGGAAALTGERREVAVLLCDLRDFTPLAERLEPEALTALLNGYFAEMVTAVHAHHGMVDKFIGDAVMAVFGLAPCPGGRTAEAMAVDAAAEMRRRLAAFNAARPEGPALAHGIGIHAGPVVAGTIGSAERLEYTVIGATVNVAARIEAQTRALGEPVLVSGRVAAALAADRPARSVGQIALKGVTAPMDLFAPA